MDPDSVAGQMRSAATVLLKALTGRQRELAARPFADDAARRWLEYRPRPRPGACIADMSTDARKAAHRLFDKCCTREASPRTAEVQGSLRDPFRGKLTQGPAVMIGRPPPARCA